MAHLERNIESEVACKGPGIYPVRAYVVSGRKLVTVSTTLNRYAFKNETPANITKEVQETVGKELGMSGSLPLYNLAAFCVMKECERKKHDTWQARPKRVRLERLTSVAIARSLDDIVTITNTSPRSTSRIALNGVGQADLTDFGTTRLQNVIYLPTTLVEDERYATEFAIRCLPHVTAMSQSPYAMLHTMRDIPEQQSPPQPSIELVVTPDHMQ
jgi:hypothetical protein